MAIDWKSRFGEGKWVTVRGSHVYIQEGSGLRAALSKLNGSKKKITSPIRKAPKLSDNEKKIIGRNEDTIKRYNQADPNKDWESFTKLDDAARKARYENQMIKAKREPGRGQTINDYRNPQFTKGDNYSLVGNRHVTSRVNPDASKTGTADQELNQLYAQRRPYGNRTYTDPRIKGSWEESTKEILKNARAARKANGTNGKLRSPIYSDGKAKITRSSQTGKLTGKLKVNEAGKEKLNRNFEDIKVKRNEDTIKKYHDYDKQMGDPSSYEHFKNETKNWDQYSKLKNAAHHAQKENQRLKSQTEPGRYQMVNDYRDPQFTKGDKYGPIGGQHITRRSTPQAIETGDATQELNQIHGMRAPYGNVTYKDKLRGNWEKEIKETLYKAKSARKKAGTEGKLRSDVYKSAPQADNEKKTVGNFVANKGASAKAEALKSAGAGKKLITGDLSKDDGKGVYTIVAPKSGKIGGKSDPDGWNVYSNMKKLSSGDFGTTYIKPDGGKVTIKNDSSRSEQVYREDTAPAAIKKTPSLKEALQEKVDAQKQPATPTRAKKSAKADTASNEAFIQRWSKPTEGRKWMEANNQITSLRTQVQQMKASGKSTAALEAKIKKLTHENLLRYGKYGPDDE